MEQTPQNVHDRFVELAEERGLPAPPHRPVHGECCERFCDPCVWDYYERALARWIDANDLPGSEAELRADRHRDRGFR